MNLWKDSSKDLKGSGAPHPKQANPRPLKDDCEPLMNEYLKCAQHLQDLGIGLTHNEECGQEANAYKLCVSRAAIQRKQEYRADLAGKSTDDMDDGKTKKK